MPALLMVSVAGAKTPIPGDAAATVADEPGPEIAMVLATPEIPVVLQPAAIDDRERAAADEDTKAKAAVTVNPRR